MGRSSRGERALGRSRALWPWARTAVGAAILAVLVWQLGTGPFLEPFHRIDAWSLAAAAGIAVPTTACCAWRWRLVSRGLGSELRLGVAINAYYKSQFLNLILPGGVLGDVHRAVRRGRDVGGVGHAARVVAWERTAGQAVQVALTVAVLLVLPSPVRSSMPVVLGAAVAAGLAVAMIVGAMPRHGHAPPVRLARALVSDVRHGLLARRAWPGVVLASAVVVAGHAVTFLVAARAAGSTATPAQLVPLALLVLLVAALPTNVAGWGPREGAAAWVFASAGLGAAQGLSIAVIYGVMVLVATLPGAALLVAAWLRPARRAARPEVDGGLSPDFHRRPRASAVQEAAVHG